MADTQTLKRRIRSVNNTQQITKAMELVAASKMKRAQENTLTARSYSDVAWEMLQLLASGHPAEHPLFHRRSIKNRLIIVITSDRGLAGAYNSNILRILFKQLAADKKEGIHDALLFIGNKGAQAASRISESDLWGVYVNWPTEPRAIDMRPIVTTALDAYTEGRIDSVVIMYTHFVSTIKQTAEMKEILPITPHSEALPSTLQETVTFEPSITTVLESITPRFLAAQIYQANLESIASEHSARMMAMKNASDNADELIGDLTLAYNSARQASITQELAEITSGAEAIT